MPTLDRLIGQLPADTALFFRTLSSHLPDPQPLEPAVLPSTLRLFQAEALYYPNGSRQMDFTFSLPAALKATLELWQQHYGGFGAAADPAVLAIAAGDLIQALQSQAISWERRWHPHHPGVAHVVVHHPGLQVSVYSEVAFTVVQPAEIMEDHIAYLEAILSEGEEGCELITCGMDAFYDHSSWRPRYLNPITDVMIPPDAPVVL